MKEINWDEITLIVKEKQEYEAKKKLEDPNWLTPLESFSKFCNEQYEEQVREAVCGRCKRKSPEAMSDWLEYDMGGGAYYFFCPKCSEEFMKLRHKHHKDTVYWFIRHWDEPDWEELDRRCGGPDCGPDEII